MAEVPLITIDDQLRQIDELIVRLRRYLPAKTANTILTDPPAASNPPTTAEVVAGLLGVICIGSIIVGIIFETRKFCLSGVPYEHYVVNEGGRYFYVPRGGGLIEDRKQVSISQSQYHSWQINSRIASLFIMVGVLACAVASAIVVRERLKSKEPPSEKNLFGLLPDR
jgi:hypothetical protein